ncbi:hypothetical protein WN59_00895 [Salinicoccus sediminis]|uniref:Protein kinase domain-containing protein n=2 Tax=Salinicoccus sediminis TaxID=1432562 RepID=A0A0M2SQG5_9STAP|nr:hypothetical protein WN59_00895 [Salinicoccus sediminis]
MQRLQKDLSEYNIESLEPFNKGWSGDVKYIAKDHFGKRYLLRLSPIEEKERVLTHVEFLLKSHEHDVPTHKLVGHDECLDNRYYYLILEWIEGEDAEQRISSFSKDQQYELGVQSGETLRKIHAFDINIQSDAPWPDRYNRNIDRKIKMYEECELKYEKGYLLLDNLNRYRELLQDVDNVPLHGDFHIGNMLIDENNQLHIIDFNRHNHGDPWQEFNRITWCVKASHEFASGRINGYFDNQVPENFWKLLLLYISTNTLSSLPWAVPFGDEEIRTMRNGYEELLNAYDGFEKIVPDWYMKEVD